MIQLDSITWHQDSIGDVSVVVWYQAKSWDFWCQVLRGDTLYGDLAAETGTTIQHLQPNGPTYDRWIPGLYRAPGWSC